MNLKAEIKAGAESLGFVAVGFTRIEPVPGMQRFKDWIENGQHADMNYLASQRSLETRSDPRLLLPTCQTVISLLSSYPPPEDLQSAEMSRYKGRIAAYALQRDYHEVLRERLDQLAKSINELAGDDIETYACVDSAPILEKGYAIPRGNHAEVADPAGDHQNFGQWLAVAHMDAGLSYALMLLVSLAFLAIGSITLGTAGPDGGPLVPAREETTALLSRMLTVTAGPQARTIFLIAALAILSSTILGLVDGKSRALRTAAHILAPRSRRWSDLTCYRVGIALLSLIIFALLFTGRPVVLIVLISALEAPVLSLAAVMLLYLLHTRLRRPYRPGFVWHTVIVAGTLTYCALSVQALIATVAEFGGQ